MMKLFRNLNIGAKLSVYMAVMLVIVSVVLTVLSLRNEADIIRTNAENNVDRGLHRLAVLLDEQVPQLRNSRPAEGMKTALRWSGSELVVPPALGDPLAEVIGAFTTVLAFNQNSASFERMMTSLKDSAGRRTTGTALNTGGPVHAALIAGRRYFGEDNIFGTLYMTGYEPILGADGQVIGAIAIGSPLSILAEEIREGIIRATITSLILLILAIGVAYAMLRRLTRPLVMLTGVVDHFAAGEYETEVPALTGGDEIGRMAAAVATLREKLIEGERVARQVAENEAAHEIRLAEQERVVNDLEQGLTRLADGDLTTPIASPPDNPFPVDYEALRQSFNAALERVGDVLANVLGIGRGVRDASQEISQASRELSSRAETQAATLEESAAALNHLTTSVSATAERAVDAERSTVDNRTGAETGADIVQQAVTAMEGIERSSEQINRIIGVIDDIAFQTNLLALNAGVEAARAGDAGRGFAVVASEVRLLARRSSESAKEIKTLISESSQQVKAGSSLVGQAGESLAHIVEGATDGARLVTEIAAAATEQASGISELNTGINHLDEVTQQNSAMAEETDAAASNLLQRAEELMTALAGFRIGHQVGMAADPGATVASGMAQVTPRVVDWSGAVDDAASRRRTGTGTVWHEF